MKAVILIVAFVTLYNHMSGQTETYYLKRALSKTDTVVYKRIIRYDKDRRLYHVRDYYENGQIQMDAFYSSFDKSIKEGYQCNYPGNTKEGPYTEWYDNGQAAYSCRFKSGVREGFSGGWYRNGKAESAENWKNGQLHGSVKYWSEKGEPAFISRFSEGENLKPQNVSYRYQTYLPEGYDNDKQSLWPLVIFLHGGSSRGTDLNLVFDNGIPDQIYRGRKFPFIVISPQCPEHKRWTTDNWFDNLYNEIAGKYRIDTSRIYLTGLSLGAEGVWYIAAKYPGRFAAIAPVSGFTSLTNAVIENIANLYNTPVSAYHSAKDDVVPVEETQRIIKLLEGNNPDVRFLTEPDAGHRMHWSVYSGTDLYDWLLRFRLREKER